MSTALKRRNRPRRGVTLVEMLVVVALVVLMMVILVQIFQSALGAMSASRTTQELDVVLRSIDSMIRSDLAGSTAKMTPPNDPAKKQGYFEYGENSPADLQGEDTDDYLAFTTKAPEGQFFTGRQYLSTPAPAAQQYNQTIQPATVTSQVAEVIYFLRNGNLYRRVFLVAPDRASSITLGPISQPNGGGYNSPIFGSSVNAVFGGFPNVSWLGFNEISARPGGFDSGGNPLKPIYNDLGDLTNRENRAFRPRFINDFNPKDGVPDDNNGDDVNDYYPTLYFNGAGYSPASNVGWAPNTLVAEQQSYATNPLGLNNPQRVDQNDGGSYDVYAFPFIYPGMYSVPDANRATNGLGWVHYQPTNAVSGAVNHAPLDLGDTPAMALDPTQATQRQTWWGFPTWRETMAGVLTGNNGRVGWTDPVRFVGFISANGVNQQPLGLRPIPPTTLPASYIQGTNLLPPIYLPGTSTPLPYFDGVGSSSFVTAPLAAGSTQSAYPNPIWEDDLILTNVRSFDVKAYDPAAPLYTTNANFPIGAGYQDLGFGSNPSVAGSAYYLSGLAGSNGGVQIAVPFQTIKGNGVSNEPQGFGHEGRIPPLLADYRYHPRYQGSFYNGNTLTTFGNVADPNTNASHNIIRLTRVWDSWSTAYTNAPDSDVYLHGFLPGVSPPGQPIYPSFPAPYPSPLRGLQIQIRVTDPRNERTKVLTIRVDFSDKL